jgi:diguanylate cyclase (GGDEF)-like protein
MSSQGLETQQQLHKLKLQLERMRISQRDTSLKSQREQKILKRFITTLSNAHIGSNSRLDEKLAELRQQLEHNKDVSDLIPNFAILERLITNETIEKQKNNTIVEQQLQRSAATLKRIDKLPLVIRNELAQLLSRNTQTPFSVTELAIKILNIYERTISLLGTQFSSSSSNDEVPPNDELLRCLSEELQSLITELDFDGEPGDQLIEIRSKLLLDVQTDSLIESTLQVLKLVIEATNYERKTSEQFLEQVNISLSNSMKNSAQNLDQSQVYFEQRQSMNSELSGLINESQNSFSKANDLKEAKLLLNPLLSQLASLSERVSHSEEREQVLLERLYHSKNQLENLFEKTQDYRRRLEDQTQRMLLDPLTKVYNRAALVDKLELEYRRWLKSQHPLRVVILDIDKFKSINSNFGYTAGDKALKVIARTISNELANTDTIARFAGEEFIIILPEQDDPSCHTIIQNIQRKISQLPFKFKDQQITITLTAASVSFKQNDTPDDILSKLNHSLLQAKKLGPNQLAWK